MKIITPKSAWMDGLVIMNGLSSAEVCPNVRGYDLRGNDETGAPLKGCTKQCTRVHAMPWESITAMHSDHEYGNARSLRSNLWAVGLVVVPLNAFLP